MESIQRIGFIFNLKKVRIAFRLSIKNYHIKKFKLSIAKNPNAPIFKQFKALLNEKDKKIFEAAMKNPNISLYL